jgi:hypothetical protein
VTLRAFQIGVRAYQGESGKAQVIELGAQPRIHVAVTHLTLRRKTESDVAGPGCQLELFQVAADTVRGQTLELSDGRTGVAGIALQRGMSSDQRKAILMLLDFADGNAPSIHGMALLASRSKLATVDIRMAIGTLRTDFGKHEVGVALATGDFLVHPAQRILRLVVVEFGDVADGLPSAEGMAILAGDGEIAMRTASGDVGPRVLTAGSERASLSGLRCGRSEEYHPHDERYCREHGVHLLVLI